MKIFYNLCCSKWWSPATVASVTEEVNFKFYLNSHMRRVAIVLDINLPQLHWFENGAEGR